MLLPGSETGHFPATVFYGGRLLSPRLETHKVKFSSVEILVSWQITALDTVDTLELLLGNYRYILKGNHIGWHMTTVDTGELATMYYL